MTTTSEAYYIVESSGDERQMWGPYLSLYAARKAAGNRHVVVTGSACRNGRKLSRGELQASVGAGAVHEVESSCLG